VIDWPTHVRILNLLKKKEQGETSPEINEKLAEHVPKLMEAMSAMHKQQRPLQNLKNMVVGSGRDRIWRNSDGTWWRWNGSGLEATKAPKKFLGKIKQQFLDSLKGGGGG